jgi:ABC-2 type transport system ATP-binding protein
MPETLQLLENMGLGSAIHEPDGSLRIGRGMERTKEISKAIIDAGIGLEEIYLRTMTLEEYYLGMTGGEHNG